MTVMKFDFNKIFSLSYMGKLCCLQNSNWYVISLYITPLLPHILVIYKHNKSHGHVSDHLMKPSPDMTGSLHE